MQKGYWNSRGNERDLWRQTPLSIHTTDSPEAMKYNFMSSTNVLFEEKMIPLDTALDAGKLQDYLSEKLS